MILGFKLKFSKALNNKPTGFVEKIKAGIKIHTFREDKKERWKEGRSIQYYTGNYRQKRTNFTQDGTCKSTQTVAIHNTKSGLRIRINSKDIPAQYFEAIARNDGFDSLADFQRHFVPNRGDRWRGKIIHWTDYRY